MSMPLSIAYGRNRGGARVGVRESVVTRSVRHGFVVLTACCIAASGCAINYSTRGGPANCEPDTRAMLEDLEGLKSYLTKQWAYFEYRTAHDNFDINAVFRRARDRVSRSPDA